jgi:hypothetical protein
LNLSQNIKVSQTHGYDEISNNILKACKTYISSLLSYLCNRVLFEGVFPDRLKYAKIIPVYKKVIRIIYQITDLYPF